MKVRDWKGPRDGFGTEDEIVYPPSFRWSSAWEPFGDEAEAREAQERSAEQQAAWAVRDAEFDAQCRMPLGLPRPGHDGRATARR